MQRADIRSRIGSFGLILIMLDDGKNLQELVDGLSHDQLKREEPVREVVWNSAKRREEWRTVGVRRVKDESNPTTPVMPDSPMTFNELEYMKNPPARKVWVRWDEKTKNHVYRDVAIPPLTRDQRGFHVAKLAL